jgi:hypothetical protein
MRARQRAYVAWLVCNQTFRRERDQLREDYGSVYNMGRFPREPTIDLAGWSESSDPPAKAYVTLYRRWGLSTLTTWDLPLPLEVERRDASSRLTVNTPGPGLTLFVPWYALRDRQLDLHAMAGQALQSPDLSHLTEWFKVKARGDDRLGYIRLGYQYRIYRNLVLALRPRYKTRLRKQMETIDKAFASFVKRDVETIRKVRQDLTNKIGSGQ